MATPAAVSIVSTSSAQPTLHTIAALNPWRSLPRTRRPMELPKHSRKVDAANAINPMSKGHRRDEEWSAYSPASGLPANKATL